MKVIEYNVSEIFNKNSIDYSDLYKEGRIIDDLSHSLRSILKNIKYSSTYETSFQKLIKKYQFLYAFVNFCLNEIVKSKNQMFREEFFKTCYLRGIFLYNRDFFVKKRIEHFPELVTEENSYSYETIIDEVKNENLNEFLSNHIKFLIETKRSIDLREMFFRLKNILNEGYYFNLLESVRILERLPLKNIKKFFKKNYIFKEEEIDLLMLFDTFYFEKIESIIKDNDVTNFIPNLIKNNIEIANFKFFQNKRLFNGKITIKEALRVTNRLLNDLLKNKLCLKSLESSKNMLDIYWDLIKIDSKKFKSFYLAFYSSNDFEKISFNFLAKNSILFLEKFLSISKRKDFIDPVSIHKI
jgi:hypothetical protein